MKKTGGMLGALATFLCMVSALSAHAAVSPSPRPSAHAKPRHLRVIGSITSRAAQAPFNSSSLAQRVFPREAYRDQGQPDVASVLDETPGALVSRPLYEDFAAPDVPRFALVRAGLPYETPVAIDGTRISLPSTGTLDLSLVPTYVLQQVEVIKGPGDPALLGDSVDGALNLQTAQPTAQRRGMLEFEGDSQGGQFSDLAYDGTMPGGKIAFATMFSIDGSPGPLAALGLSGNPGSDALRKALLVDLRATPSDAVTFDATVLATNLDRALAGTYGALLGGSFVTFAPSLGARQDERLRFEQLAGRYAFGDDAIDLKLYGFDLGDDGYAANISLAHAIDRERGAALSWSHESGSNEYALSFDGSGGSAYAQNGASVLAFGEPLPQGSGVANLRATASAALHPSSQTEIDLSLEDSGDATRVGAGPIRDWSSFAGRLGLSQSLTPQLALRASAGESGVAPLLDVLATGAAPQYSLGFSPQYVSFSSQITREESASGEDLGLEWRLHGDTSTLSFDLYDTQTIDAYAFTATQPAPGFVDVLWSNAPPMHDEGAELSLVQFKRVGLGFIVQVALPRTFGAAASPANVPGIPYAQGYGEISYKWPRGSRASFGALYVGPNNAYVRGAFTAFNANLELSLGARSKLQLSGTNLFNSLGGGLPIAFVPGGANVLGPPTVRFMVRQSFGQGAIYEH